MQEVSPIVLSVALVLLVLGSAFFSSSETALMALNRYRLRHAAKEGDRRAQRALSLLRQPDRLIGVILLGNNIVNILAATIATVLALELAGQVGVLIAPFILTAIILVFAEVAPKTFAATHPERIAYPASALIKPMLALFFPLVWLINQAARLVLVPLDPKQRGAGDALSAQELRTVVADVPTGIEQNHRAMLLNMLDLEAASIIDVMVPRNEIFGLDLQSPWPELVAQISRSSYTRMPVFEGGLDNTIGILHVRTVIAKLARGQLDAEGLRVALRKPYFVPNAISLLTQLSEFQARERRMGLVVDEYGDIQGLVTLDDILEEIVGEFTTEPGRRKGPIELSDGKLLVDGGESLRVLNRQFGWKLPTEGARTVNGLVLEQLGRIPEAGTQLIIASLELRIVECKDNQVRAVEISPWRENEV